jgi:hypothetical protein
MSEYQKKYYESNKLKLSKKANEKFDCICCGGSYSRSTRARHQKSKKHVKVQQLQEAYQDLLPLYHQ